MLDIYKKNLAVIEEITSILESELAPVLKRVATSTGLDGESLLKHVHDVREILAERRKVVLGIIGQVKVGKSSLLNALFFDGEERLPIAPTPKTARLTWIRACGKDNPSATVYFYTRDDWQSLITKAAEERAVGDVEGVYTQMVENASRNLGSKMESLLGKSQTISLAELDDYVGVDGRYSDLVKYTDLKHADPLLDDLEIVDTPGTNDPVQSRELQTIDFLQKADAVIFLSSAQRFLDSTDMALVLKDMIRAGLSEVLVVVPQVDLLRPNQRRELDELCIGPMTARAVNHAEEAHFGPLGRQLAEKIFTPGNTLAVSAMMATIAAKMSRKERLTEAEEFYSKKGRDNGWPMDSVTELREQSNIDALRDRIQKQIISRKGPILLTGPLNRVMAAVNDLAAETERRVHENQEQMEGLRQNLEDLRRRREVELTEFKEFKKLADSRILEFQYNLERDDRASFDRVAAPEIGSLPWFGHASEESAVGEELSLAAQETLDKAVADLRGNYMSVVDDLRRRLEEVMPTDTGHNLLLKEFSGLLRSLRGDLEEALSSEVIEVRVSFNYGFWDKVFGGAESKTRTNIAAARRRADGRVRDAYKRIQAKAKTSLTEHVNALHKRLGDLQTERQTLLDQLDQAIVEGEAEREALERQTKERLAFLAEIEKVLKKLRPRFERVKTSFGTSSLEVAE